MSAKHATTSAPILSTLTERWSPRAFDSDHSLPENALLSAFEAARWSPSANNSQPWRFIVARRGTESFAKIEATLAGFNSAWAGAASALVVNLAVVKNEAGEPQRWAEYDLGQAVAHLSVQAHSEGLYVHQMGGFDAAKISEVFGLGDDLHAVSVMTIGKLGLPEQLAEPLKERELAPRSRLEVDDLIIVND
ncbi:MULTISPECIES: nitroreductase family protein [Leucobacter]|uniref:nitroreductase family protein n=1 Tax=Leucobacter TaxID=55968 RepID=UPI000E64CB09|nr:nitroreductase family protein [Leucobacter aridicollis]UTX52849.1 nitroreductase family protein [Leucobacter aridicollis]